MEEFGIERREWLCTFLELPNGIPDSDTFRRLFERLKPQELSACLSDWLEVERAKRSVIAVDGKPIRGSGNRQHKPFHVVSAFVAENQITLGELVVEEKSNEITAVPALLNMLDIEYAIITADAMSCQRAIAQTITDNHADYVLAPKDNQHDLLEDTEEYFSNCMEDILQTETMEKGHGRIEHRQYQLLTKIDWLEQRREWAGLKGLGCVRTTVTTNGQRRQETRYFITSLTGVKEFADVARKHWSIENQLHWNLDVIFREDASRARKDHSPLNLNVMRKLALVLVNSAKYGRLSKKKMTFKAALNPDLLLNILFPAPHS